MGTIFHAIVWMFGVICGAAGMYVYTAVTGKLPGR
jgi:hypothetical protein